LSARLHRVRNRTSVPFIRTMSGVRESNELSYRGSRRRLKTANERDLFGLRPLAGDAPSEKTGEPPKLVKDDAKETEAA
jgi:hypothetical protein